MAAPKHWGYTRENAITDEILTSWCDGDLTAAVAKEVDERLLRHPEERARLARYARACARSTLLAGKRDFLDAPRKGLLERCLRESEGPNTATSQK
jgi:anti-sigma factor RsiW